MPAEQRNQLKSEGNAFFAQSDFSSAVKKFSAAIAVMIPSGSSPNAVESALGAMNKADRDAQAVLWANRAMCHLKLTPPDNQRALEDSELAVSLSSFVSWVG